MTAKAGVPVEFAEWVSGRRTRRLET